MADNTSNTVMQLTNDWKTITERLIQDGWFTEDDRPALKSCYSKVRDHISEAYHICRVEGILRHVIEPGTTNEELKAVREQIRKSAMIWIVKSFAQASSITFPGKDETLKKLDELFTTPLPHKVQALLIGYLLKGALKLPAALEAAPSIKPLKITGTMPAPDLTNVVNSTSTSNTKAQTPAPVNKSYDLKIFISGKYQPVYFREHPEYCPLFEAAMKQGRLRPQPTPGSGNLCGLYAFAGALTYHYLDGVGSGFEYEELRQQVVEECKSVMANSSFLESLTPWERQAVLNKEELDLDILPAVYKLVMSRISKTWNVDVDAVLLYYNIASDSPEVASTKAVCLTGDASDKSRKRIVLWIVLTSVGVKYGHYEWLAPDVE